MSDLIKKLGYKTSHGKNYNTVRKRIEKYNISTSHFTDKRINRTYTEDEVFCSNSVVSQKTLRSFYLKQKDIKYECVKCGVGEFWNGKRLTLQLDHVDGNNNNNLLHNLRWLCPNCHSQTKTYAGKNINKKDIKHLYDRKRSYCIDCGKEITTNAIRCKECLAFMQRKVQRPTKDELKGLLLSHHGNFTAVSRIYNVSDNTIKNWCKKYDIPFLSKNYK